MGAAMGFAPVAVRAMSLWEFGACLDGWIAANSAPDDEGGLSAYEFEQLGSLIPLDDY
jgi:hypothetical protein